MAKREIYVSIDIETDGPVPAMHSMLSFGAAAFVRGDVAPIATYEATLDPLPGATQDPDTMEWWKGQGEAWALATANPRPAEVVLPEFRDWARSLPGSPVMIVFPSWDYMWMAWYLHRFTGGNPFGLGALDLKTLAWSKLGERDFKSASKKNFPRDWFKGAPRHNHHALTDAIGQGVMFINMLKN